MSTEQTDSAPPPQQWGAPPPAPPTKRWTARKIAVAVAVAVGIAAAGGVAIYAASGSVNNGQDAGNRQGGPVLVGGPMGGMQTTDHGEFQTGEVEELTDKEITAKSRDGYTRTYVINDKTQLAKDIKKGDEVMIIASVEGTTATAESIIEPSEMQHRSGNAPKIDSQDDNDN